MTEAAEKTTKTWSNADGTVSFTYEKAEEMAYKVFRTTTFSTGYQHTSWAHTAKSPAEARKYIRRHTEKPTRADGKSYRVDQDGPYTSILLSDEAPDGITYFSKLEDAKRNAADTMRSTIRDYEDGLRNLLTIKEEELS